MGSLPKEITCTLDLNAPALVVRGERVPTITKDGGLLEFMESIILKRQELDEPFYVLDLGVVISLYHQLISNLPMVHPYYAVKCNPEPAILETLAALGSNFDCASPSEIQAVLALSVSPDRIIYANACKPVSHIKYAASVGVNLTTFDSIQELDKIRKWHPKCELLIRIKSPVDGGARYPLDSKFGANPEEVAHLLGAAQASGLAVIGVAFHIGSEATNLDAFHAAIAEAKTVFETAARLGMTKMRVLDIGGGFACNPGFHEAASIIKDAIQTYFPNEAAAGHLSVISEPGRFLADTAFTLATKVIGKRVRDELREYWINDGKYGSFGWLSSEEVIAKCGAHILASASHSNNRTYRSTVFGPTCAAVDKVFTGHQLPELEVNDWLVFSDMGAYTTACGTNFNGFNTAAIPTYVVRSDPTS